MEVGGQYQNRFAALPEPTEISVLVEATQSRYRTLVLTAAYTGLRWGELAGLRPERVNLLRQTVHVTEQLIEVRGELSWGPPKTNAGKRSVTLPSFLVALLQEQIAQPAAVRGGLVFPSPDGSPMRRNNFRRRVWLPATRRAGLEGFRFHDLRHTAVALSIAQGAHPKAIQERLGHSSITVTLDRYGHLFPTLDQQIAERLDQVFVNALADFSRTESVDVVPLVMVESAGDRL